jgi:hypothetical protein
VEVRKVGMDYCRVNVGLVSRPNDLPIFNISPPEYTELDDLGSLFGLNDVDIHEDRATQRYS